MQVYSIPHSSICFSSKNNPIKPFMITTKKGELCVREFTQADADLANEARNLAKFFLDGFISNTKDPWFLNLKDNAKPEKYTKALTKFTEYYKKCLIKTMEI